MNWYDNPIVNFYLGSSGRSYSNMGRLFIRLFVGVMMMQFGIRHLVNFNTLCDTFPTVLNLTPCASLIIMIAIELICSLFTMVGFLTRMSVIPPIAAMIAAEYYILHDMVPNLPVYGLDSTDPGYLPIMFIGIYLFILIVGPGKISLDYFTSLYIIDRKGKTEEEILEEV